MPSQKRSGDGMAHHGGIRDARAGRRGGVGAGKVARTVLHVGGLNWASEKAVVEGVLGRRPGVGLVEANPVSQTATVTFDTAQTSVAGLRRWVQECGYACAGQSVPSCICDPMAEPDPADGHGPAGYPEAAGAVPTVTPGREEHPAWPVPEAGGPAALDREMPAKHAGHEIAAM